MKRLSVFLLTIALVISFSLPAFACNENQTNTYILQVLFGDDAPSFEDNPQIKMLLNAIYLCSEQSEGQGQGNLAQLKSSGVGILPSFSSIDISSNDLMGCSHNTWEYEYTPIGKEQANRKKILQRTVNKVCDFGFVGNIFGNSKSNSFSAFLYYIHILSDYLSDNPGETEESVRGQSVPSFSGQPFIQINGNVPSFTSAQKRSTTAFTSFSGLDSLKRCGVAFALIGPENLAPPNSRQQIGNIRPSGWEIAKYPGVVNSDPAYLYNRCHLIAHQLSNNDTAVNLITGTRYLNETGMKPFEDEVAKYIRDTGNHVLYRSTPVYSGDNLVASGVQLEAYSIEDHGEGISFNVYCYNVQPGVSINYTNGSNEASDMISGMDNAIPFAVSNPSPSTPDLIYEISKHLEILFDDQKKSPNYISMMDEINTIANAARVIGDKNESEAQRFITLKGYEYDFLNALKRYVPLLLQEEPFFNNVFKQ